jgi:spore coat protein U-like protein
VSAVRGLVAALFTAVPALGMAAVSCSVTAIGPSFGIYNPLSATPTYANGQVTATCTLLSGNATTVSLVSSYSSGASGNFTLRTMLSGANTLGYNLYYDAAYSQVRGNGTGGSQSGGATLTLTPGAPTQTATGVIYGRIPANQDPAPGSYVDTIVVTVTY